MNSHNKISSQKATRASNECQIAMRGVSSAGGDKDAGVADAHGTAPRCLAAAISETARLGQRCSWLVKLLKMRKKF